MALRNKNPLGGGLLIFIGFMAGAIVGIAKGQASIGVLVGVAVSSLIALALWLMNRRAG